MNSCRTSSKMFQFLIGSLKTKELIRIKDFDEDRFQFLIGSLKTTDTTADPSRLGEFQFLIGSLKTPINYYCRIMRYLFQFLIGSLKTYYMYRFFTDIREVSIPHR